MRNTGERVDVGAYADAAKRKYRAGFLFAGIPDEEASAIVDTLEFSIRRLSKGESVICHGSHAACFGVIVSGRAIVCRSGSGRRLILRHMEEGAFFGASSLFGGEGFPTDIVADCDCVVAVSSEAAIESLLTSHPQIAMNYIRFLTGRIRFLNDSIDSYSIRSADRKIAKFLIRLCPDGKGHIKSYTRAADELGIGRASLYRSLDGFEKQGLLSRDGQDIMLTDPNALRLIADGE